MYNLIGKIIGCIVIIAGLLFFGFMAMLFTTLQGGVKFYTPLSAVVTAVLILFVILRMFTPIKPRILYRSLAVCFGLCLLTVAGYEINYAYHNSIETVGEQDVDLEQYRPFQPYTKAAKLEEPSTLKLESGLPRIDGATAFYPLYAAFVQAVYPEKQYDLYDGEVMVSKTPQAYENLIVGNADVIFAFAPSESQLEEAKRKGKELKLTPIGREAFVFFVNAENPVKGLTTGQIQDIYSGKITNWKEVGGPNEAIRAFQRPENSGSQSMLQRFMEDKELMTPPQEDVVQGMGRIIEQTANYRNYKNAIGYSFLYFATEMASNGNIRLLEVDGVKPEKSTISSKEYPLTAEFYAVTAGSDNPNVSRLIEWILSPQGQWLVEKTGYVPIADPAVR
ncbi:PstS family phosphate ABC transporter substrate-binding protein [Brevibacillus borstelensis]|uniref:PstS family phosphate ABC transporter substrate-binding protein n=1 Tax=Brevibacillus borstelensis TaxID=45462 RepID=UPI003CF591D6